MVEVLLSTLDKQPPSLLLFLKPGACVPVHALLIIPAISGCNPHAVLCATQHMHLTSLNAVRLAALETMPNTELLPTRRLQTAARRLITFGVALLSLKKTVFEVPVALLNSAPRHPEPPPARIMGQPTPALGVQT